MKDRNPLIDLFSGTPIFDRMDTLVDDYPDTTVTRATIARIRRAPESVQAEFSTNLGCNLERVMEVAPAPTLDLLYHAAATSIGQGLFGDGEPCLMEFVDELVAEGPLVDVVYTALHRVPFSAYRPGYAGGDPLAHALPEGVAA